MDTLSILRISLEAAVPLHQIDLRRQPFERVQALALDAAQAITAHGDDLLYGGRHCAETFNRLAQGLAALSLQPGGVTAFGLHWEANPENRD